MKKQNVLLRYINDYLKEKHSNIIYEELSEKLSENLKPITQSEVLRESYRIDILEAIDYHIKVLRHYMESFERPLYLEEALKNDFSLCPLCEELERSAIRDGNFYDYEDNTFNDMCYKCKHYAQTGPDGNLDDEELEEAYEEYYKAYHKYQNFLKERHRSIKG